MQHAAIRFIALAAGLALLCTLGAAHADALLAGSLPADSLLAGSPPADTLPADTSVLGEGSGDWAMSAGDAGAVEAGKPFVVMIHADWCGTCRVLEPVWEQIRTDLAEESNAVAFDVTDRPAYAESAAAAHELGIGDFFSEYRGQTGTIAVLSCDTREPVAIMKGERDLDVYRVAIEKAACKPS